MNSNLKTGSPDQVHGAMRVLAGENVNYIRKKSKHNANLCSNYMPISEFIKYDITDIQFPQIATTMLPELLKILQADKVLQIMFCDICSLANAWANNKGP